MYKHNFQKRYGRLGFDGFHRRHGFNRRGSSAGRRINVVSRRSDIGPSVYIRKRNNTGLRENAVSRRTIVDPSRYISSENTQPIQEKYTSQHSFDDFPIDNRLIQNIYARGYEKPTPIQDQAIFPILEGRDVVGIANTGTGKTAAFLIPVINKILNESANKVLIVIPTRELAVQIDDEFRAISKGLAITSLLCIGGVSINRQIFSLQQNPSIIIGTPGRLKDLSQRRFLDLSNFKTIILDEVDRMVDIGFIQDIKYIVSLLSRPRQSLFFSATISPDVGSIIQSFLTNPVTIKVKVQETLPQIEQDVIRVRDKNEKLQKLDEMLRQEEFKKVLIFGRTKWGVERLSRSLQQKGFNAASIHGNKSLNQRLRVLTQFKLNQLHILVATDVAARGLDIENVSHVINFDEPSSYTDYVHRIGRTGRAQKSGKALTFVG
ncbi:MAG: DEAD/DEAH box helicase [Patescibacteria group bacterium]|nr:DEAD/DEAH box helicase [Patescibacteria group bacterium]